MLLENYIKDLLYRYDCVIVPGLGAFVVKHEDAIIDVDTNDFFPPRRKLVFNGQLQSDDALLINYIGQKENLDHEDAKTFLSAYVKDLMKALSEEGSFEFRGLGKLQMEEENQISFIPQDRHNFNKSSFGLSKVSFNQVHIESAEDSTDVHQLTPVEEVSESSHSPWLKYAAIFIVALFLGGFGLFYALKDQAEDKQQWVVEEAEEKIQQEIQSANFFIAQPLPTIEIEVKSSSKTETTPLKYHVIAGAFREKNNADKKVAQLKKQGFEARYLGTNKYNLHQVAFTSFAQRNQALDFLTEVRANGYSSAWLLVSQL